MIGGLETSVTNTTSSIYLEGAVFNPVTIRKSSKAVGIRTESSSRYEKGISSKNTISAVTRAILPLLLHLLYFLMKYLFHTYC